MEKEQHRLRSFHKKLRDAMTAEEAENLGQCICERIRNSDLYRQCSVLYAYYPLGNEVDCLPVIRDALAEGKTVALPRTALYGSMDFYRIEDLSQVAEGSFHVMEPVSGCPIIRERKALALVPGVVFGRDGSRYGYGKGYYDRYFARYPGLYRIAPAYEHQMEDALAVKNTDVRMDRIYTEIQVYHTLEWR